MTLTADNRRRVIFLAKAGRTTPDIAAEIGCSQRTVQRWLQRNSATGGTEVLPKSGRPRCTDTLQDIEIVSVVQADPQCTLSGVREEIATQSEWEQVPARTTIFRRLHEAGMVTRVRRQWDVRISEPAVQEKRLRWAEQWGREWAGGPTEQCG